jgi:hypothetical protein
MMIIIFWEPHGVISQKMIIIKLKTDTPLNIIHCEIRKRLTGGHSDRSKGYFKSIT